MRVWSGLVAVMVPSGMRRVYGGPEKRDEIVSKTNYLN
jgi:hypothetical protein